MTAPAPEATTATATAYTPVVTDLMRLARVSFSPAAVYEEVRERPTFWMPWAIVAVAYTAIQLLMRPFQQRLGELMAAQAGRPTPAGAGGGAASTIIGLVAGPLTVLVICAIAAGILYVITAALGGETTFKKMLTVTIFTWPLAILTQLLTWGVLTMRGVDSITGPTDMIVSLGVDNLLPSSVQLGHFLRFLLVGIGPIQIWSLAITAIGISILAKASKGQAWTVATVYFVLALLMTAGLGALGMKMVGG